MLELHLSLEQPENLLCQDGDVVGTLPQWGNFDPHHVQAMKQIQSETSFRHFYLEIAVGGCNDPRVDLNGLSSAETSEGLGFQEREEFGLQLQ